MHRVDIFDRKPNRKIEPKRKKTWTWSNRLKIVIESRFSNSFRYGVGFEILKNRFYRTELLIFFNIYHIFSRLSLVSPQTTASHLTLGQNSTKKIHSHLSLNPQPHILYLRSCVQPCFSSSPPSTWALFPHPQPCLSAGLTHCRCRSKLNFSSS